MHRTIIVGVIAVLILAGSAMKISAQSAPVPPTRAAMAQKILSSPAGKYMTSSARQALEMAAHGDSSFGHAADQSNNPGRAQLAQGGTAPSSAGLPNVRVNDPSEDSHQADQTTQSETSVAVSGSRVAVGFNDSQTTGLFLTAGSNLTGYAYSQDGGSTWHDGGVLPNPAGYVNLGDPWLASDRSGNMYFSTLSIGQAPDRFGLDVAVARSTNGGQSWSQPVVASSGLGDGFYEGDKDAMTVGRDPAAATRDDVYVGWDDFTFDPQLGPVSGLPVARSTDGGQSFQVSYANKVPMFSAGCSFQQYIGAQPLVDPKDGTLYLGALKLFVNDPTCTGAPLQENEVLFVSTNGGQTFSPEKVISSVTPATANGLLDLAPGQYMRNIEFPTLALFKNALYAAWNDGGSPSGGPGVHSHIRVARSTDGGATWTTAFITQGNGDELQPAMSADSSSLHILYYERNQNNTLDVYVSDSPNGSNFSSQRVTSQSFPGVLTLPQFDPIIAPAYMGDYIANVSDGSHQYFAWGDNRDTATSVLFPQGRNDPDVFFSRR